MSDNIARLGFDGREIILIGTAHISRESMDEVQRAIREERPGMVCVELDAGRHASMTQKDAWERLNVSKVLREGKGFLLVANMALARFQSRLGSDAGVKPGEEMLAAIVAAEETGARFALCDREVQITLRRAWAKCGFPDKMKLIATLFSSAFFGAKLSAEEIENLKKSSELDSMMEEMAGFMPAIKETLIDERDRYLAAKIWAAHRESGAATGAATIAVLGAGHLKGTRAWLERHAAGGEEASLSAGLSALEEIPPRSRLSKCLRWVVPAALLALVAYGFVRAGAGLDLGLEMLKRWVLWNGGLAALGAALALAHPAAIIAAFVSSPFTTGNPFLNAGIFAGLAQATARKPRVSDASAVSTDITSLKGIYKNRITKTLLVFLLTNLGSGIGAWPAIVSLAGLLTR
ncbi:MAG: TraB/GumN family protein [Treponema sp.]|nr:TraB/GumN family protein [Treponema sp.]